MGLFSRLFGLHNRGKPRGSSGGTLPAPFGSLFFGGATTSGKTVNERTALQTTAVYSCVRILAEAVAALPLHIYRHTGQGKEKAVNHPLYRLLHYEPNPETTSFIFRETLMTHLLLWGK